MFVCFGVLQIWSVAEMWVEPSYTIDKVKAMIRDKAIARGFKPRPFGLYFAGQELEKDRTLSYYGIDNKSLIMIANYPWIRPASPQPWILEARRCRRARAPGGAGEPATAPRGCRRDH